MAKEIRLLTADEIDVRVAQTTNYDGVVKVNLLLYKDARVDMKVLDELYGPMGWKRSHQLIGDRLYCTIEIWDAEKGCWIAKQDVGTESNTEPEKGQASDAFKRAGFNWGIGRELYTAPKVQVVLNPGEYREAGSRIQVWASFYVDRIAYDVDRNICELVIRDRSGNIRYDMNAKKRTTRSAKPQPVQQQPAQQQSLTDLQYWSIVRAYGDGRKTQTGGDYREEWIRNYSPTAAQIDKFDLDVRDYKSAKAGEGVLQ